MNLKHIPHAKAGRITLNHIPSTNRSQIAKRRSGRMFLSAAVGTSGEDRLKCTFSMPAKAVNLNKHGGAIQISRDLVVGSVISMRNQRNVQVPVRVVTLLKAANGISTYGIEFVEHDENARNFWGISFPSNS